MCRKIPTESTGGLTGADPHLQIHGKMELNYWTWQLGRTTMPLFNICCRITWPRQGRKPPITLIQHFKTLLFWVFLTVCYKGHSCGKWRWFCTNAQTLPEALAIQPWALLCLTRFDWCSGTSACPPSTWYQAKRFQTLLLSHSQITPWAVQWPLQLECKDSWIIRPCKLHHFHREVSLGLMYSFIFVSEWIVGASEGKSLQDNPWYHFLSASGSSLHGVSVGKGKNQLTQLLHSNFHNEYVFTLVTLALCPENKVLVPSICPSVLQALSSTFLFINSSFPSWWWFLSNSCRLYQSHLLITLWG